MTSQLLLPAQTGFILLSLVYFYLLLKIVFRGIDQTPWSQDRKSRLKTTLLVSLGTWTVFVSLWALSGIMADFTRFPFNFMPVIIIPLITMIVITLSPAFKTIVQHIPAHHIIRLQSFRFFVELLLWALFVANAVPVQMTFEGRNFDILAGITAPLIAWLSYKGKISRSLVIMWNFVCLALLINIVTIAILSTPSPIRMFTNEPANTIVAMFPVCFLPGLLVPLAYTLHFFSLRQLLSGNNVPAAIQS
jgi:hypothetical protein